MYQTFSLRWRIVKKIRLNISNLLKKGFKSETLYNDKWH